MSRPDRPRRRVTRVSVRSAGLILLLALALPAARPLAAPDATQQDRVTRGPFQQILVLTGSLDAAEADTFAVPLTSTWELQLTWLIEEGARVGEGDAIARFDPAGVQDRLEEEQRELLDKRQQRELKLAEARQRRLDLQLERVRAEGEYRKAAIDASVPASVIEGAAYRKSQLEKQRKKKKLEEAELAEAAEHVSEQAELFAIDVGIEQNRDQIERYEDELDELEMRASRAGIVVHEEHPWWGRKIREGDRLQASMLVASIPDLSTLQVAAWASEAEALSLAIGQPATIFLDAYPEKPFRGEVLSIGRAGELRPQWGKAPYFSVRLGLDQPDVELMKPGMSVRCEIVVADYEDALQVPLAQIGRDGERAWVKLAGGKAVAIELLGREETHAAVRAVDPQNAPLPEGGVIEPPGPAPAAGG
ncbi:MAG: efflux RND transporter periplasmic adaptor subunit [Acidobacteriota bacterium]|nr:MAG: efflux RND transporter periplasmic adaptor subunit [Acidobacteriota bacterium]